MDFFTIAVPNDNGPHRRCTLLSVMDEWSGFAQAFVLESGTAAEAKRVLQQSWFKPHGAPKILYCDPDTVFRSEEMRRVIQRYCAQLRTTAAESPWQHGRIERWHQTMRRMVQATYRGLTNPNAYSIEDVVEQCVHTRNDHTRVRGVSPYVLVFGSHPRREAAAGDGGGDLNSDSIVATLLNSDPGFEAAVVLREAAGKACLRHLMLEGIERAKAARPTPYRGPYYPGDIVQCYRHTKSTAENRRSGDVWGQRHARLSWTLDRSMRGTVRRVVEWRSPVRADSMVELSRSTRHGIA